MFQVEKKWKNQNVENEAKEKRTKTWHQQGISTENASWIGKFWSDHFRVSLIL